VFGDVADGEGGAADDMRKVKDMEKAENFNCNGAQKKYFGKKIKWGGKTDEI